MIKRVLPPLAAVVLVLCLCSCKGYRETDNEYYVTTVCFEKEKENFRALIEVLTISSDDKKTGSKVFAATGKTPYDAVEGTTSSMPKTAVFDHCSTAIIGSEITGEDFKSVVKYLYDTKNLNLGIYMYTAENITGILELKPQTPSVGYDIMDIESSLCASTGISLKNKYYEICSRQISSDGFCLPEVSANGGRPAITGQTVYVDYMPVLTLDRREATVCNLIYSGSGGGEINISGKKCGINGINSNIKAKGDTLFINIKCRYRSAADDMDKRLKSEVNRLINKLSGNAALKVLGVEDYEKIGSARVTVNGK